MCDCISKIDVGLSLEGQCIDATMFGERKATVMLIRKDKWKHENRRSKPTRIIASYCPFCGEKYDCGAESNWHNGAVGNEKRAEQSSPGGGHEVTEHNIEKPYEQRPSGMNPRPEGFSLAVTSPERQP